MIAAVNQPDVVADKAFFDRNPQRRYRFGTRWVTRRRGRDIYLRVLLPPQHRYVDTEAGAELAWWDCAYPFLTPIARRRLAAEARRSAKALRTVATPARTAAPRGEPRISIPKVTTRQGAAPGVSGGQPGEVITMTVDHLVVLRAVDRRHCAKSFTKVYD